MQTIEEWNEEGKDFVVRLHEKLEAAETPTEALVPALEGLEYAALNYFMVSYHGSDGSGAASEDVIRRASRALADGARIYAMLEMKSMAEERDRHPDEVEVLEDAAELLEERSDIFASGDERAREGS